MSKRELLVSDEYLSSLTLISDDWPDGPIGPVTTTEVRNIYEAARAKDAELIQQLVDAWYSADGGESMHEAIAEAAAQGFTPTPEQ